MNNRNNIRIEPRAAAATGCSVGAARLGDILRRTGLAALGLLLVSAGSAHAQTVTLYDLRNNLPGVRPANLRVNAMESTSDAQDAVVAINVMGDGREINFVETYFVAQSSSGIANGWNPVLMDFRLTGRYAGTASFATDPLHPTGLNDWEGIFDTPANVDWLTALYTNLGYNVYHAEFVFPTMMTMPGVERSVTWSGHGNIAAAGKTQLLFSDNSGASFGASNDWRWINSGSAASSLRSAGAPFPTVAARVGYLPCPVITTQPLPASTCSQGTATISVAITPDDAARPGLYAYQWQWQPAGVGTTWVTLAAGDNAEAGGVPVVHAANVNTATLEARPLAAYINFAPRAFRCIVTNLCGSATSDPATLTVTVNSLPSFSQQPDNATACPAGDVTFSIAVSGTAPLTYQWRKGGVPIDASAGGNPSAATATLTLMNVQGSDADFYDCIVTDSCGSVTSNPATLTICIGDFNCDGGIDGSDVGVFFEQWEAGNAIADANADGGIDGADVSTFFERWEAGC